MNLPHSKPSRIFLICVFGALFVWAKEPTRPTIRNVIVIIGDGMGLSTIDTVSLLTQGQRGFLNIETMPITGLMKTFPEGKLVPDSAAAGTALATGYKTTNATVSMDSDQKKLKTILEFALETGLKAGVITTSYLVDATPAVFTAHVTNRKQWFPIINQMLDLELDVMMGGDWGLFDMETERARTIQDRLKHIAQKGHYRVIRDAQSLSSSKSGPAICLFPHRGENIGAGPPLEVSTTFALDILKKNANGFFLVIESEETDSAGHQQDIDYLKEAVLELDDAVGRVLNFAREDKETLVIVTADHVTGAPGIVGGSDDAKNVDIVWHTTSHTAQWVPIFAFGPGAGRFSGVHDNTEIPRIIANLLGWKEFSAN